jgi:hypothetical protein
MVQRFNLIAFHLKWSIKCWGASYQVSNDPVVLKNILITFHC